MTIKEIAEALNVSTATVSNVIHGHLKKMSPETAEIIRKKLEEYQYIPNMGARMLAQGDSSIIGVITNYPNREEKFALQDPFVSQMVAALENAIRTAYHRLREYAGGRELDMDNPDYLDLCCNAAWYIREGRWPEFVSGYAEDLQLLRWREAFGIGVCET